MSVVLLLTYCLIVLNYIHLLQPVRGGVVQGVPGAPLSFLCLDSFSIVVTIITLFQLIYFLPVELSE